MLNLIDLTIKQLKSLAKSYELTGYSKLRKNDLIELIMKKNIFHSAKNIKVGSYLDKDKKEEKPIMHEIRFLDSAKFMASSLEKLVNNMENHKLHNVKKDLMIRLI